MIGCCSSLLHLFFGFGVVLSLIVMEVSSEECGECDQTIVPSDEWGECERTIVSSDESGSVSSEGQWYRLIPCFGIVGPCVLYRLMVRLCIV